MHEIQARIAEHVQEVLPRLTPNEQSWLQAHLITPRVVSLSNSISGAETIEAWLITDNIGLDDASYRLVYVSEDDLFGYECTLENDRQLFLGRVGSLFDAIDGL